MTNLYKLDSKDRWLSFWCVVFSCLIIKMKLFPCIAIHFGELHNLNWKKYACLHNEKLDIHLGNVQKSNLFFLAAIVR